MSAEVENLITNLEVGQAFCLSSGGNLFRVILKDNPEQVWVEDLDGFKFWANGASYLELIEMDEERWEAEKVLRALKKATRRR
jgi:hypothetical protein